MTDKDKKDDKSVDDALANLKKKYGEAVVMKMSDKLNIHVDTIPTGAMTLDIATGIGGIPRGRIVELYGPESSGKSTLAMQAVAAAQRMGDRCAYIDAEHALDAVYARNLGVETDDLFICQPDYGEQGLEVAKSLIETGGFALVVIDSVAAMTPRAEIEGEIGDSHVGLMPRMWGQAMRMLAASCGRTNTTLLLINQIREKIGVIYGTPETQPGGRAIKFFTSMRLDIRRIETTKEGGEAVGNRVRVKIVKNKLAPPFTQAEFSIDFGKGVNKLGCLLDVAVDMGIVTKGGAWYSRGGWKVQGRPQAVEYLEENPDEAAEIDTLVRDTLGI